MFFICPSNWFFSLSLSLSLSFSIDCLAISSIVDWRQNTTSTKSFHFSLTESSFSFSFRLQLISLTHLLSLSLTHTLSHTSKVCGGNSYGICLAQLRQSIISYRPCYSIREYMRWVNESIHTHKHAHSEFTYTCTSDLHIQTHTCTLMLAYMHERTISCTNSRKYTHSPSTSLTLLLSHSHFSPSPSLSLLLSPSSHLQVGAWMTPHSTLSISQRKRVSPTGFTARFWLRLVFSILSNIRSFSYVKWYSDFSQNFFSQADAILYKWGGASPLCWQGERSACECVSARVCECGCECECECECGCECGWFLSIWKTLSTSLSGFLSLSLSLSLLSEVSRMPPLTLRSDYMRITSTQFPGFPSSGMKDSRRWILYLFCYYIFVIGISKIG